MFGNKNAPNGNCFLFSPCSSCVYRQDSGDEQKSGLVEGYDNSFVDVELWLTAALVGKWQPQKIHSSWPNACSEEVTSPIGLHSLG